MSALNSGLEALKSGVYEKLAELSKLITGKTIGTGSFPKTGDKPDDMSADFVTRLQVTLLIFLIVQAPVIKARRRP